MDVLRETIITNIIAKYTLDSMRDGKAQRHWWCTEPGCPANGYALDRTYRELRERIGWHVDDCHKEVE